MGAINSNRKRYEECLTLNNAYSSPDSTSHVSKVKRLKFSFMPKGPTYSAEPSQSAGSIIPSYPEGKTTFTRAALGPCLRKFPSNTLNRSWNHRTSRYQESKSKMDNVLDIYEQVKENALKSLRGLRKRMEVVEIDADSGREDVSEDSSEEVDIIGDVSEDSSEEVDIIGDGREGRSLVMGQRRQCSVGPVIEILDSELKVGDGGIQQQSTSSVVSELTNGNLKVNHTGEILRSLNLSQEHGLDNVVAYKELLKEVERRSGKLERLDYDIKLNQSRRSQLESSRPKKRPEQVFDLPHAQKKANKKVHEFTSLPPPPTAKAELKAEAEAPKAAEEVAEIVTVGKAEEKPAAEPKAPVEAVPEAGKEEEEKAVPEVAVTKEVVEKVSSEVQDDDSKTVETIKETISEEVVKEGEAEAVKKLEAKADATVTDGAPEAKVEEENTIAEGIFLNGRKDGETKGGSGKKSLVNKCTICGRVFLKANSLLKKFCSIQCKNESGDSFLIKKESGGNSKLKPKTKGGEEGKEMAVKPQSYRKRRRKGFPRGAPFY